MGKEIERKFLVKNNGWQENCAMLPQIIEQYYFLDNGVATGRLRIVNQKLCKTLLPQACYLTFKSKTKGITRTEIEIHIPYDRALELKKLFKDSIYVTKFRYESYIHDPDDDMKIARRWEVDVFTGENKGLIVAEIELENEKEKIVIPPWIGEEVSGCSRYGNVDLALEPFSKWKKDWRKEYEKGRK
jgi:CYTH domain-containing protein